MTRTKVPAAESMESLDAKSFADAFSAGLLLPGTLDPNFEDALCHVLDNPGSLVRPRLVFQMATADGLNTETLELTQGINDWAELGFYVFTSEQDGHGVQWVGDHIRPRVRAPDRWHLPVGLSLSTEIGYQRAVYSTDTWTWEIRPIVDKTLGRGYLAFNPALERTLHGPDVNQGLGFSPGVKVSHDFTPKISGGFEYYADYGRLGAFDTLHQQQQQIFAVTDLNVSPKWEINFGVGLGPTAATDHLIVKGSSAEGSTGEGSLPSIRPRIVRPKSELSVAAAPHRTSLANNRDECKSESKPFDLCHPSFDQPKLFAAQ
jgi:hypothetical protein